MIRLHADNFDAHGPAWYLDATTSIHRNPRRVGTTLHDIAGLIGVRRNDKRDTAVGVDDSRLDAHTIDVDGDGCGRTVGVIGDVETT